jgi:hypothetical protein
MAVLVGIYLVQCVSIEVELDGETAWIGAWTVSRSPSGNRHDWEPLTDATTSQGFADAESARRAGEDEGTAFAQKLQGDDCLEPMAWCVEALPQTEQDVSSGRPQHTAQRSALFGMKASPARCSHLH